MVLFILFITFLINRYLVNQEKEKGNLKRKISESEMQTLRSQMNPHFLFNSLNSINSFIVQQKSREASSYLTTFSKLMRNILENSRYESITLEKEINTLKMYLEIEAVRLEHKFDYEIIIDKNIELEFIKIPPLIIQPFAENAIWHGLNNKPNKGLLKIEIQEINENCISISIIDDGIGRKAAALLKKEQLKHKSYGIDITINRLQLVNSKNNYRIIDLSDDNDKITGTKVELQIYYDD
jgi:LytS/YehU family sensor histidine kinase